jgi:hypothetical protein
MARTTQQIYQAIIDEKETLTSLDALTPNPETTETFISALATQSAVGIWRLTAWVFAFMAHIQETLWDNKETELETIRDETPPHTRLWWERKIKAFQFPDTTIVDDLGNVTYETIDESLQIVSRVNVKNIESALGYAQVNVRVVKFSDPDYVAFDASEQSAFDGYIEELKPLGVKTNVQHNAGGLIRWEGSIWIDPALVDTSLQLLSDLSVNVLDLAMTNYINEYAMVKSKLNEHAMVEYILDQPGLMDVAFTAHKWRETPADSFQNVIDLITGKKELEINSVAASWDNGSPTNLQVNIENAIN